MLDLRISGSSKIIGDRSYSRDPNIVSKIGDICIQTYKENSIGTIIKHIPGHGSTNIDSHKAVPVVLDSHKKLELVDFSPFKNINSNFVMTVLFT